MSLSELISVMRSLTRLLLRLVDRQRRGEGLRWGPWSKWMPRGLAPRLSLRAIRRFSPTRALAPELMAAARNVVRDDGLLQCSRRLLQPVPVGHLMPRPDSGQPRILRLRPNLTLEPLPSARSLRYHAPQRTGDSIQPEINEFVGLTHESLEWVIHLV